MGGRTTLHHQKKVKKLSIFRKKLFRTTLHHQMKDKKLKSIEYSIFRKKPFSQTGERLNAPVRFPTIVSALR